MVFLPFPSVDTLPPTSSAVGSRACVPCPEGTWADGSGFRCVECGVEDCGACSPVSHHSTLHRHGDRAGHSHLPPGHLTSNSCVLNSDSYILLWQLDNGASTMAVTYPYKAYKAPPPPSQSMVSGGVCFPSVPALPQPPAGVFPYYAQHFSAAAELCKVRA